MGLCYHSLFFQDYVKYINLLLMWIVSTKNILYKLLYIRISFHILIETTWLSVSTIYNVFEK